MSCRVTFKREQLSLEVEEGTTLLEAMRRAGLAPDAPCGGRGTCGKCTVFVGGRPVNACRTPVTGPVTVETRPDRSAILTGGPGTDVPFDPVYRRGTVTVPRTRDCLSQWQRLQNALEDCFGEPMDALPPDLTLASELYSMLRSSGTWQVILGPGGVMSMTREPVPCYAAAIDLGTTTVVGYLIDMDTGKTAASCSRKNPQVQFGADVLLRADYALKHGPEELSACVRSCIQEILTALAGKAGIATGDIFGISLVGNTCMHHLLLGLSPASLVHAPYNPAVSGQLRLPAGDLGLTIHPRGEVILLPNIAGFVGSDTLGCLLCTRPDLQEEVTLLIDVGTNGELVLGSKKGLITCSTAAGPAFEGANIQCGMRGADGAIDHVTWDGSRFSCTAIGGAAPVGICGSGLIDLTACLMEAGLLGETGILKVPRISLTDDGSVFLTQEDIRQIQLAKAAIAAGIRVLLNRAGLKAEQVDRVFLAGAFGTYMNPASACRMGLIPRCLEQKITLLGNAAGEGAVLALKNRRLLARAEPLARSIGFAELASDPDFQDYFVDELEFSDSQRRE